MEAEKRGSGSLLFIDLNYLLMSLHLTPNGGEIVKIKVISRETYRICIHRSCPPLCILFSNGTLISAQIGGDSNLCQFAGGEISEIYDQLRLWDFRWWRMMLLLNPHQVNLQ